MSASPTIERLSDGNLVLIEAENGKFLPMLRIEKFKQKAINPTLPDLWFPAFNVDNNIVDEIYISQFPYPGLARETPKNEITLEQARTYSSALGSGFHLMTAWEWAAFAWTFKAQWQTDRGWSDEEQFQNNGAGTFFFRMPAQWWGAWGMTGNLYEILDGAYLRDNKLYAMVTNSYQYNNAVDSQNIAYYPEVGSMTAFANEKLENIPVTGGIARLLLLHGEYAVNCPKGDGFALESTESLMLERGGAFHSGVEAGLGAFRFTASSANAQSDSGFRVAYIP